MQRLLSATAVDATFPLRAGWEPTGPDDVCGPSVDRATQLWPRCPYAPPEGALHEVHEVFAQEERHRRRHLLVYPSVAAAQGALVGVLPLVGGDGLVHHPASGELWTLEVSRICWPEGEELHVLGWSSRGGLAIAGGVSSTQLHRHGRALLISSDSGWGIGYDAAVAADAADRAALAPGLAALAVLGRG